MPSPLVAQYDVETALVRPLTSTEGEYIDSLCDQASTLLRAAMPTVDARMAANAVDATKGLAPELVAVVLASVIKRYLVNPKGLWSTTNTTGPWAQSEVYPGQRSGDAAVDAGLTITPGDLARLNSAGRAMAPRMIQLRSTRAMHPDCRDDRLGWDEARGGWYDRWQDCD